MKLVGTAGQFTSSDFMYDASGTIASGSTPQLLLPRSSGRSIFLIENTSSTDMWLEIGAARATASLSSGTVASCSVTNVGFGYSRPPSVTFLGGLLYNRASLPAYTLVGMPDWPSPSNPAQAHCVMTGAAGSQTVSSIVIDNPGAGYAYPPYVFLQNDPLDPFGCAAPSSGVGILLKSGGGSYTNAGVQCTTDPIAVFCSSSTSTFACKFMV